jgi:hypothetical protein
MDEDIKLWIFGLLCLTVGLLYLGGFPVIKEVEVYEEIPIYHNTTIERVEMIPCNLSCLDARNEGYLEGVAECEMHEAYITALDGRIRSYVDNNEGFYSSDGVMCLQTGGRTTEQIVNTFFHELMHRNVAEYSYEHFCGVQG